MSSHSSSRRRWLTVSLWSPWQSRWWKPWWEVEPVALAVAEPAPALEAAPAPSTWENLDTGNEFQALFFDVAGVTFAGASDRVGGIHQLGR